VVAIKDSQVVFSDNTILGPRGNSDVSADNSGLSLSGSTSGVFSCLDVKDSARGVVVDRSGSGLADLVISDSNLAGRTVTVDNATALTTDGVWWGQPGGPTTGQVSNPHNLNDVSPADAPVACAGAPAVTVTPPSNVHASPRAQTKMLVTWKQPDPPAGHHIVATDVVANCYGIPEALVFNGSAGSQMFNSLSGPSPPCTYHVRVVTGAGGTEAASNAAPVIVLWPTVTNIQHPSLADLTNVSSFPISAQSIVDTTVTIRVYDLNGREVRATRVAGDSGVVFANFDLRGLNEGTLYVEVSGVDAGGTSVPNATRGSFVKSTTAHPDTVQNIRPVSGNQQVIIYWSAPIDTHGRTVTSYTVTLQPGNKVKAVTQLNWPDVTFLLLKNNTVYTATITPQTSSGPLPSALTTFIPRTGWELDATPALFDLSDTRYYQADQDAIRPLGLPGDVPITGDFAGTGAQFLLWRPATGTWIALPKSSGVQWGQAGDLPVPADYNGDGKTDYAVWRPSTGSWYIRLQGTTPWGTIGDIPVPADYNGDGRTDLAVFRPSTAKWYVKGQFTSAWGRPGDIPVPGDYNGDGRAEMAVFRPSTGHWYLQSGPSFDLGSPGDVPVPAAWDNNGGTVTRAGVFHRVTATSTSTVGKTYQSSLNARNAQPVRLPYAIYQAFWNPDGSRK
jgi:hypothetical protein